MNFQVKNFKTCNEFTMLNNFSSISDSNLGIKTYEHVSLENIKYRIDFIVYSNCETIGLSNPLQKKQQFSVLKKVQYLCRLQSPKFVIIDG